MTPGTGTSPEKPAPLVSVVIPTYNRAHLIEATLESVASSSWRPVEIVIADDGSTDGTSGVVADFAARHPDVRVQYLERPHEGANHARNAGVAASSGAFVFFLDSDDLLQPPALSVLMSAMDDPQLPYCVAQLAEIDAAGTAVFTEGHSVSTLDYDGVVGSHWSTIVALYRRELLDRLGAFDTSLKLGEDKEFLWRMIAGADRPGKVIPDIVALRRNHGTGQLTDAFTPATMGQNTIAAIEAFVAWARQTDRMRPAIARAAYPRLWIATIRAGVAGERAWVERAIDLAAMLEGYAFSPRDRALRALLHAMPRAGYCALFAAMEGARNMIHAFRNAKRRLKR
tara:strand:- start:1766 stop:2788 length:1023 start_codon:yes stop_codon:yes gene_type:complete